MTTDTRRETSPTARRRPGASVPAGLLRGSLLATAGLGAALVALGAVVSGGAAALGALAGVVLAAAVFVVGAVVVIAVTTHAPQASLLVALSTYALQVALMGVVLVSLAESGLLADALDRRWVGAGVIAVTLVWSATQLLLGGRARIPAFDGTDGDRPAAGDA